MENERSVLVVEHDEAQRDLISTWLMDEGYTVLTCPGPCAPNYSCLGGRGHPCPLANAVETVVLDLRLASDEMMEGTAGWQLMTYYLERGKRVVALSGGEDFVHPTDDRDVEVVARPAERVKLLKAVRTLRPKG